MPDNDRPKFPLRADIAKGKEIATEWHDAIVGEWGVEAGDAEDLALLFALLDQIEPRD